MSAADPDLDALLAAWAEAVRNVALRRSVGIDCERARAAIDAHLAAQYVRRDRLYDDGPWAPGDGSAYGAAQASQS